jgi:hypothetical protein
VHWAKIFDKGAIPMIVSPLVGFTIAYLFMVAILGGSAVQPAQGQPGLPLRADGPLRRSWRWGTACRTRRRPWA